MGELYDRAHRFGHYSANVGMLPIVLGCITVVIAIILGSLQFQSSSWPTTPGTVTESRLDGESGLDFEYTFVIGEKEFRYGEVDNSLTSGWGGLEPAKVVEKYPVGTTVTVYYEPELQMSAVLEPGIARQTWLLFFAGLVFIFVGILLISKSSFAVQDWEEYQKNTGSYEDRYDRNDW